MIIIFSVIIKVSSDKVKDKRNDARMVRWMCNAGTEDRISAVGLKIRQYLNGMRNA